MKKLAIISAIVLGGIFYNTANAQVRLNVGFRFGVPHMYAPPRVAVEASAPAVCNEEVNYGGDDDYYYLPDVNAYYSIPEQCYYYNDGGEWVSAAYLPGYRDFDWRNARRFEVRAARPYLNDNFYRTRFGGEANRGYVNSYRAEGEWNNRNYANNYRVEDRSRERFDNRYHDMDNHRGFNQGNYGGRERFDHDGYRH